MFDKSTGHWGIACIFGLLFVIWGCSISYHFIIPSPYVWYTLPTMLSLLYGFGFIGILLVKYIYSLLEKYNKS